MVHAYKLSLDRSVIPTIILYVTGVSFFTWLVEPDLFAVLLASSPILLHVLLLISQKDLFSNPNLFWISPVILPTVFIGFWFLQLPVISDMDGPVLFLLQLLYSYLLLFYIYLMIEHPKQRKHEEPPMQDHLRKSDDEKAYYQQLAYDYYDHAKYYANQIEKLQEEINNMRNISQTQTRDDEELRRIEEQSNNYLRHLHTLESQLKEAESYKDLAESY